MTDATPPANPDASAPAPQPTTEAPRKRSLFGGAFDAILAPLRGSSRRVDENGNARSGPNRTKHTQYRILFVDVGNASRSQVAQAYATIYGFHAESAGTFPAFKVAPEAVVVMADQGIDIGHFRPKPLDVNRLESFDKVITMGDSLPKPWRNLPNVEEWNLLDPQSLPLEAYRRMQADCEKRVRRMAKDLGIQKPELVVLNA